MAGIYLRHGDTFIAMREAPYEAEHILQKLVADHPEMLAGDDPSNGNPRWLLIERESSISNAAGNRVHWSADHLFIDQDGVPTIVETKRSGDPRIRREVVAQMLDYAANGVVMWSAQTMCERFQARCTKAGLDPDGEFVATMGGLDPESFWEQVHTNLAARRLRLVFVADSIPPELARIVEFLNEQMQDTEVLAIEVKQFVDEAGAHQTIVPRAVGQTQAARQTKRQSPGREWTRESILAELETKRSPAEAAVTQRIFEWSDRRGDMRTWFGTGRKDGCFMARRDGDGYSYPFGLYTYGRVEIQFQYMARQPPFDDERLREQLRQRLNAIAGVNIPADALTRRPSIALDVLAQDKSLQAFLDAMDWTFEQSIPVASE